MKTRAHGAAAAATATATATATALGMFALLASTCGGPSGPPLANCSFLDDPVARWDNCGVADYSATQQVGCFCSGAWRWTVVVRDGRVVDAIPDPSVPGDPEVLHAEALAGAWTVEQMFERVAAARPDADRIIEEYDTARGYATHVFVDRRFGIADDEISYRMWDFVPGRFTIP